MVPMALRNVWPATGPESLRQCAQPSHPALLDLCSHLHLHLSLGSAPLSSFSAVTPGVSLWASQPPSLVSYPAFIHCWVCLLIAVPVWIPLYQALANYSLCGHQALLCSYNILLKHHQACLFVCFYDYRQLGSCSRDHMAQRA